MKNAVPKDGKLNVNRLVHCKHEVQRGKWMTPVVIVGLYDQVKGRLIVSVVT